MGCASQDTVTTVLVKRVNPKDIIDGAVLLTLVVDQEGIMHVVK